MNFDTTISFIGVILTKYSIATQCAYNYSDRKIDNEDVITLYEGLGGSIQDGCPLLNMMKDFPSKYHEYIFGMKLSPGACISVMYQKGKVPYGGGPYGKMFLTENDEIVEKEAFARGGNVFDFNLYTKAFVLPYATIYTTINRKHIRAINDNANTITLDISLTMMWMDYKIYTHHPDFSVGGNQLFTSGSNEITIENSKKIWKPDLPVHNLYDFKAFIDSLRMVSLKVLSVNHLDDNLCIAGPMVKYEIEAKITIYCEFDFSNYPMDHSNCKLRFGGQRSDLKYTLYDPANSSHGEQLSEISDLKMVVRVAEDTNSIPTKYKIGLDISLQRQIKSYLLKYYLPCVIITLVSQCSFLIPLEALPGRVALVVTQLLTLTSLFIHQMVRYIVPCYHYYSL